MGRPKKDGMRWDRNGEKAIAKRFGPIQDSIYASMEKVQPAKPKGGLTVVPEHLIDRVDRPGRGDSLHYRPAKRKG